MVGEIAATKDGKILAIRSNVLADHGAFNGTAAPLKYPAGFFGVFTGSYDIEAAYCHMTAVYKRMRSGLPPTSKTATVWSWSCGSA